MGGVQVECYNRVKCSRNWIYTIFSLIKLLFCGFEKQKKRKFGSHVL